jgi:acetylornithine deacetylase
MHETTRLLRDLVALPSVNPMGRPLDEAILYEHRVTAYVEDFFRGLGVRYERQSIAPQRDNIVAYHEPAGASWSVVLEVHQDTVPIDGMTIDPFGATIESGKLHGRGACDIKGGMAAMLAAFARLVRERPASSARVVMACTVDEEFTFLGVQRLAKDDLSGGRPGPVWGVVAEPTQLQIVNTHKGAVRYSVEARGRSCHSSRPELGVNAIYRMADLLPLLERYAKELQASRHDPRLGPPTVSVGRIEGGTSVNTVPDWCRIDIDRRLLPGEDARAAAEHLFNYLRRQAPPGVEFACIDPWLSSPALGTDGSEELVSRLGAAIDSVIGKHEVLGVPYGTDASKLAAAGVPSVVFGPGDIALAHTCDEWVPLSEVEQASEILYRFAVSGL